MFLTRHQTQNGPRWAVDAKFLPQAYRLDHVLALPRDVIPDVLSAFMTDEKAVGPVISPLEAMHEVWASGVTYLRSRDAREAESETGDIYTRVYVAERPELFLKAIGWRVIPSGDPIHIRKDSTWDVPEPELTLVVNRHLDIIGYCAGNDVSSRNIEGENPLYLPQAKVYSGSCALGPGIQIVEPDDLRDLPIRLEITRGGTLVYQGETRTSQMKRRFEELVAYLGRELSFPHGVFLMTGTGVVPPDDFTLQAGDVVTIKVGDLLLENPVTQS